MSILRNAIANALFAGCLILVSFVGRAQDQQINQSAKIGEMQPVKWDGPVALELQLDGVEWKGFTYHLVKLSSIRFHLDEKTDHLKAEVQAASTSFDDVDYDISAAVFGATGQMLGAARAECHVERLWIGTVVTTAQTIALDFGRSLDFRKASSFTLTISKQKVLTPSDWQEKK